MPAPFTVLPKKIGEGEEVVEAGLVVAPEESENHVAVGVEKMLAYTDALSEFSGYAGINLFDSRRNAT